EPPAEASTPEPMPSTPSPKTSAPSPGPGTPSPAPKLMRYKVCADTLSVRAAPEKESETTTVATLTRGHTFVVQVVKDSTWVRGYSPEVAAAKGWTFRRYLSRGC
ncbi:MAG: hypothetical protein ACRDNL_13625, partial [Spirillospora sp.]